MLLFRSSLALVNSYEAIAAAVRAGAIIVVSAGALLLIREFGAIYSVSRSASFSCRK